MKGFLESLNLENFKLDLAKLLDWQYLTEPRPESFASSGFLILALLIIVLATAVIYVLLRKRFIVIRGKRKVVLKKNLRFNFVFALVWLLFVFLRLQGVVYLSMRLWQVLLLLVFLAVNVVFVFLYLRSGKVAEGVKASTTGANYYQDYLPRKSKKRKK